MHATTMRWSITLTMWLGVLGATGTGCVTGRARARVELPPPPPCKERPRVRDFCLGEIPTGEDCMVCTNVRGCLDERRSAYCVNADFCEDPRCDGGTSATQRGSGLLIE